MMPGLKTSPAARDPRDEKVRQLNGLPFVALHAKKGCQTFAGELSTGEKFTIEHCEQAFNGALCLDAIDGPGAHEHIYPPPSLEILAEAERRYGNTVEQALLRWVAMPKTEYERWEERPRVLWHGKVLA